LCHWNSSSFRSKEDWKREEVIRFPKEIKSRKRINEAEMIAYFKVEKY
jgi:hypothetical protein